MSLSNSGPSKNLRFSNPYMGVGLGQRVSSTRVQGLGRTTVPKMIASGQPFEGRQKLNEVGAITNRSAKLKATATIEKQSLTSSMDDEPEFTISKANNGPE